MKRNWFFAKTTNGVELVSFGHKVVFNDKGSPVEWPVVVIEPAGEAESAEADKTVNKRIEALLADKSF